MKDSFRFWDENSKKMVYFDLKNYCDIVKKYNFFDDENYSENLMRCTGMKDINNNFIYEGDIIKVNNGITIKNSTDYGIVFWNEKKFYWSVRMNNIDYLIFDFIDNCEIVGNIYETRDIQEIVIKNNLSGKLISHAL